MAKKKLSWSEEIVGRPLPKDSPYIDQIMAGFVKADGAFCGRMEPGDRWLRPAWTKARRAGWVKHSGLGFGKNAGIWFLTDRGETEALAAKARVTATKEARTQWSRDFTEAHRKKQEEPANA
ncbi:hypothetical protein HLI01_08985 [Rhizobium laguerreae]|uniref:hypothetical protein n=1 Tax=Rhizobium laguerreae TaxID=1076926 RepID=UPI001478113C|nr:hypothetical protein [Rhizobium laguerreae]NNH56941.1 hypothetical protein [Rhizobium laguerreae]